MNPGLGDDHASILYYDGDYPSADDGRAPENFDETTVAQGLSHDVARFLELAHEHGDPVLDIATGTGRIAIPLARQGFRVVGVDVSRAMLDQFRSKLEQEAPATRARIDLVRQDASELSLPQAEFPFALIGFNSLLCIPEFGLQLATLKAIGTHVCRGGHLAIDLINPLILSIGGDRSPTPFFTRKNPHNGRMYTRFAAMGPFDARQRQKLYGWYDEISPDGTVRRTPYEMLWRPIFRYEIELMLREAGFEIVTLEGGHQKEPYLASSRKMFVVARRE